MSSAIPSFTPEESAQLTRIWDRLYELYLEQANGSHEPAEVAGRRRLHAHCRNRIGFAAQIYSCGGV